MDAKFVNCTVCKRNIIKILVETRWLFYCCFCEKGIEAFDGVCQLQAEYMSNYPSILAYLIPYEQHVSEITATYASIIQLSKKPNQALAS